jgi:mRNA-degrading endonuclease RelE of RelBE toxin-antitoxin system
MAFTIEFSPDARDHFKVLRKRDQQIVVDAIAAQLTHQPDQPTSHRKPLEDNPIAP